MLKNAMVIERALREYDVRINNLLITLSRSVLKQLDIEV
jgi:hypothetical protein